MNSLLESLDPLARLAVQALLNSVWQGVLIAAFAWVLLRALGRVSATTRHALWLVSLLTISSLPLIGLLLPQPGVISLPKKESELRRPAVTLPAPLVQPNVQAAVAPRYFAPPQTVRGKVAEPVNATGLVLAELAVAPVSVPSAVPAPPPLTLRQRTARVVANWFAGRLPLVLAALWLIVSTLLAARIAQSYLFLFHLRRRLAAVPETLDRRKDYLAARFGIARDVGLFTAAAVKVPMTIGWLRPLIVLPQDLPESLSASECDSVIAHELAHIKRWDYATNFAQRAVQAVLFFHPAVWFINKQLVIERELACDDWAVKLTGEPRRYASCLTKLVELLSESKPLAAATGILFGKHIISRRVEMVLNRDRNATTAVSKPALAYAIGLAFLFVFACSALSPVIAVPLGQKPAKKAQEAKPAKPATPRAESAPAVPAVPEIWSDEIAPPTRLLIDGEDILVPALPPTPPALAELPEWPAEPLFSLQDGPRIAPVAPRPAEAPLPPVAWVDGLTATIPAPATPFALAPGAYSIAPGWGQQGGSTQSKTPVIPESEMLSLLSDIVKKDSDESVRREALQGIYRMRTSDAAITTMIQLYDGVSDVKIKAEILNYLVRRNGDNAKAIAKLVQIAKSEKDETLLRTALSQLAYVKGDEGADHLVAIYDGLQDPKLKQRVINALAYNKSKKAVDKLMSIAKNDSDPTVRAAAIRSLYAIDNRLYLNFAEGTRQSLLTTPRIVSPGTVMPRLQMEQLNDQLREMNDKFRFEFDGKKFEFDQQKLNEELEKARGALDRARDASGKWRFEFDGKQFEWNRDQFNEFQSRARDAQQRAREQMRELEQRLRDEFRDSDQRPARPATAPRRSEDREQQREERQSTRPAPARKTVSANVAVTTTR